MQERYRGNEPAFPARSVGESGGCHHQASGTRDRPSVLRWKPFALQERKGQSERISVWEIHPVYAFDVCSSKSLKQCQKNIKNNSFWIPLDKWAFREEETDEGGLP